MNIFRKMWQKKIINQTSQRFLIRHILSDWLREADPNNTFNIGISWEVSRTGVLILYSTHPGTLIGKHGSYYYKYKYSFVNEVEGIRDMKLNEFKNYIDGNDAEIKRIEDIL